MLPRNPRRDLMAIRTLTGLCTAVSMGCGPVDEDPAAEATAAIENVQATAGEASFVALMADGLFTPQGVPRPAEAAMAAARLAPMGYRPADCARGIASGPSVNYGFRGCRSLLGFDRIDGDMRVTFDVPPDGMLHALVSSTGLRVEGAVLDIDTDVTYTLRAGVVDAVTVTRTTGVGARGLRVERRGSYTLRWESSTQCATLNGAWSTRGVMGTATTEVTGLRRCMARCPQPGGRVAYTRPVPGAPAGTSRSVTIDYVGGSTARWTSSSGQSGVLALACRN